jgi:threonine aldolase
MLPNGLIDFRSDTVTEPTLEMRQAMAEAVVGDDVYEGDPTTIRLEETAAKIVGKEAGLFVPSGTLGNQLALFTHTERGEEVILPEDCHIVLHEVGAAAIIAGVQLRCLPTYNGEMKLTDIMSTVRRDLDDIHSTRTALISYENADSMGRVRSISYMRKVKEIADKFGLAVHVDGARFFNAATALHTDVKEMTQYADSISICLSKGLCSPIGSVLVGNKSFISQARKKRKLLGGGMRQTGFLAAPGLISLNNMTQRLNEDHDTAQYLAYCLSSLPGCEILHPPEINMLFCRLNTLPSGSEMVANLKEKNIIINPPSNDVYRFVTHYWINRHDIDYFVKCIKQHL